MLSGKYFKTMGQTWEYMVSKGLVIGVAVVVLIGVFVWLFSTGAFSGPGKYDSFAQCLSEKGVKMYGAYWCSHCQNQKDAFGSGFKYVNYVECALPGGNGQNVVCSEAGIQSYPTWEFGDGSRQSGELSFERLSQMSGCALPA